LTSAIKVGYQIETRTYKSNPALIKLYSMEKKLIVISDRLLTIIILVLQCFVLGFLSVLIDNMIFLKDCMKIVLAVKQVMGIKRYKI
jgi:hypothetical protein